MKVFVDGVEIKGLQSVVVQKNAIDPRPTLYLKLICDLNTKEPIENIVTCIDRGNSDGKKGGIYEKRI